MFMYFQTCPDITAPTEADIDTPEMVEAAAAVERSERDMKVLDRLVELGMDLAEAIARNAKASLDGAGAPGAPPAQDPTGPFNRMAQTIRRTLALRAKLIEGIGTEGSGLATQRAARRAKLDIDHRQAMEAAIRLTFSDAVDFELDAKETERLLMDLEERLFCDEQFSDFVERPVGETVAKLIAAMGLDPALCVLDGETWKARREPYIYEVAEMAKAGAPAAPWPAASLAAAATGPPG